MYKLRTVDVWDTLLRRRCHPEASKLATAQRVLLQFPELFRSDGLDHWELYRQRVAIERKMAAEAEANGDDGEYELTAVLRRWLESVLMQPRRDSLNALTRELAEFELAFEMTNSYGDDGIAATMEAYPAEETIFLSDFYMPCSMLTQLLAHHGLTALVPNGVVSCDVRRNKRSGRLYTHVEGLYGITPGEHVHIGDNPLSDVEVPTRLGINAVRYAPEAGQAMRQATNALFASRKALFRYAHKGVVGLVDSGAHVGEDPAGRAMFQLGLQAAPLFIGFLTSVAERAIADRLDRLFFLTREGAFFLRLYRELFPDGRHAGYGLPPCGLFCASRLATFSASLDQVSVPELRRIWSVYKHQTPSALFGVLGVARAQFAPLLERLRLPPDEPLSNPADDPRIATLLADREFSAAALSQARRNRETVLRYMRQSGISGRQAVGFVDIGWRGTIQDNLARLVPDCRTVGYYLALRAFLNPQPSNTQKRAFISEQRSAEVESLFESVAPLELLCGSPLGSVIGYTTGDDGTIEPVREGSEIEGTDTARLVTCFQDGVIRAAKEWRPLLASHAVMADEVRAMALRIWRGIATRPPDALLRAYVAAPESDIFGLGRVLDRRAVPSLATLFLAPLLRRKRREVVDYLRRTQWAPVLTGLKLGPVHRSGLLAVFWLAHRYKRLFVLRRRR